MVTYLLQAIVFIKTILIFMAITNIVRDCFKIYKSIANQIDFTLPKGELILLWVSVSYILTLIFI